MIDQLIFATNNKHKIEELNQLLPSNFHIFTLKEAGIEKDLPEPFETFRENAYSKAKYIYEKTGKNCLAEDSGICVEAMNGGPGVFSARYAGEPCNDEKNLQKLLNELSGVTNRKAYYQSTIALIWDGDVYYFEGKCNGRIAINKMGSNGFGYDPIFIPEGFDNTFGELDSKIKSTMSHRKISVSKMVEFLIQK